MIAKLITLSVPTMAIISGHCYAGGFFLALAHDFRVMKQGSGVICVSEINIGFTLPPAFNAILKAMLPVQTVRHAVLGPKILPSEGLGMQILSGLFNSDQELDALV